MSERSGLVVIKLNDRIKPLIKRLEGIFTYDTLNELLRGFDYVLTKPPTLASGDDLHTLSLGRSDTRIKGNYAVMTVSGFAWDEVLDLLLDVPGMNFWANLGDSYMMEMYYGKTNKEVYATTISWDGDMDPEADKRVAELEWHSLMNKTILRLFVDENEVNIEDCLQRAKAYKKEKQKVDYWRIFYEENTGESVLFKLTLKDLEKRLGLIRLLNGLLNGGQLSDFRQAYNNLFSLDDECGIDEQNILTFAEIYRGIGYVRENGDSVYIGAVVKNAANYLGNEDDNARGFSNGRDYIKFGYPFVRVADNFSGQVFSPSAKRVYRYTIVDGFVYFL